MSAMPGGGPRTGVAESMAPPSMAKARVETAVERGEEEDIREGLELHLRISRVYGCSIAALQYLCQ